MLMFCIPALNVAQVTIASQRRYVGYWGKLLACSSENQLGLPQIELPETRHRELRRIRLYDTLSNDHVKFVISELKKIPGQLYSPAAEVAHGFCKALKKGFHRTISPRYFLSFLPRKDDDEEKKPRLVVQMDTEKPVSYMRPCLDYQFDQPLIVRPHLPSFFHIQSLNSVWAK
jgi:phosphatidylinositol-3,4,5-trisphosphate 3-phosphatase/dual-specificity protein phosphatase PTEN